MLSCVTVSPNGLHKFDQFFLASFVSNSQSLFVYLYVHLSSDLLVFDLPILVDLLDFSGCSCRFSSLAHLLDSPVVTATRNSVGNLLATPKRGHSTTCSSVANASIITICVNLLREIFVEKFKCLCQFSSTLLRKFCWSSKNWCVSQRLSAASMQDHNVASPPKALQHPTASVASSKAHLSPQWPITTPCWLGK